MGVAMESLRLDKVEEACLQAPDRATVLKYCLHVCNTTVMRTDFRTKVWGVWFRAGGGGEGASWVGALACAAAESWKDDDEVDDDGYDNDDDDGDDGDGVEGEGDDDDDVGDDDDAGGEGGGGDDEGGDSDGDKDDDTGGNYDCLQFERLAAYCGRLAT